MKKIFLVVFIAVTMLFAEPITSAWNGCSLCIERYLEHSLRDPESLKIENCYNLVRLNKGYVQRIKYRAKNGFGGYVKRDIIFMMKEINGSWKVTLTVTYAEFLALKKK